MTYKIPTRQDIGEVHTAFVESYEESGAYGVKSIGEVVINTACPSIQHAVKNAVGADVRTLPMTPVLESSYSTGHCCIGWGWRQNNGFI